MRCISISFKTAEECIRSRFAFTNSEKEKFLESIDENCIILSTCNRIEFYVESDSENFSKEETLLAAKTHLSVLDIKKYSKYYTGEKSLEHLFSVSSGLESMIIGENEILAQVKQAYLFSKERNKTGYILNTSFLSAIACAKKIKTDTDISKSALSVATLACRVICDFIKDKNILAPSVLIIGGSGVIGSSVIKNLLDKQNLDIKIFATKRNHGISPEFNNQVISIEYSERYKFIEKVDVILSATQSPHLTISCNNLLSYNIQNKLFIDLASPVDIDRKIGEIRSNQLITVDYFEKLAYENNLRKQKAVLEAYSIVEKELQKFYKNLAVHNLSDDVKNKINKKLFFIKKTADANAFKKYIDSLKKEESMVI